MIILDSVWFRYPSGSVALKGVSLELDTGEIIALMGENGAGKTTLLKHLNGLLKPSAGKVLVEGVDTRETTVASLSRIVGLVFQNPDNMFFRASVMEEVTYALEQFGYTKEEAVRRGEEVLRMFGLTRYRDSSPFTLSGGEKKRLAISIVMAWMPMYIIIDEPTSGLDGLGRRALADLLLGLRDSERGVIISSHDVEFVSELATRVVLLSRGEVVADGPPDEVLTDEELLKKASLLTPQVAALFSELSRRGIRLPCNKCVRLTEAVECLSTLLPDRGVCK